MSIISNYVREGWHYSVADIKKMFGFDTEHYKTIEEADRHCRAFLRELRSRNIIKIAEEINQEELEIADIEFADYHEENITNSNNSYQFSFVGIVTYKDIIIYSYPKYIGPQNRLPDSIPKEHLAQVIRVIEKYSREKHKQDIRNIDLFTDLDENGRVSLLSVMLFLLEDYAANGPYLNDELIIETNGAGEILWQKTVDETDPIFQNSRPCYVELFTRRNVSNDNDYYTRLHEYVVTRCSAEMETIGLTDFFSLPVAEISDDEEDMFGDKEYICNMLDAAIALTFDDRKLTVLKALKAYFNSEKILTGTNELQLIGTRSFNLIWEEVCGRVFNSQKDTKLHSVVPKPNDNFIKQIKDILNNNTKVEPKEPTLVQLIKRPRWVKKESGEDKKAFPKTFNPDYLGFSKNQSDPQSEYYFYILDAKYYRPIWKYNLERDSYEIEKQPGVEDVAKQYLYRLAYADDLVNFKVKKENVKNYFLMPKSDCDDNYEGFVELDILKNFPFDLGRIEVRMLNPEVMYDCYLKNTTRDLSDLDNGTLA